jgi:hypothetical protein
VFCLRLGSSDGAFEQGIELWLFIKDGEFFFLPVYLLLPYQEILCTTQLVA